MTADPVRQNREREARIEPNLAAIESLLRQCVDIAGRGESAFFVDDFVNRYASYAALIQIGNAVKDLPSAFRDSHAEANWRALMNTRDKVGHIYGEGIDWQIIWKTLVENAPGDLAAVTRIRDAL
ncbi:MULTISPECIES: HepT-like ribonuclease domain-containing protein [Microbacterium]|uniref:HepT-like ribonuclease domain-containing protein n=1 Tax=Microbacterium profundi TaxID=450380 RepID=A0ABV3LEH9_9MICO|nr:MULTISPECIES: HepT-like ribonuclease domain-containing protein [Microbacterium]MCE7482661.1 DUF86 domain-containing protein [Microbacterium profundi]